MMDIQITNDENDEFANMLDNQITNEDSFFLRKILFSDCSNGIHFSSLSIGSLIEEVVLITTFEISDCRDISKEDLRELILEADETIANAISTRVREMVIEEINQRYNPEFKEEPKNDD